MGRASRENSFNQWRKTETPTVHECYDQYGRVIKVGDFLMLQQHGQVVWRVTSSKPVLHPQAPPGLVELTMAAVTQVGMQGGMPLAGVIKVRDALEFMSPEQLEKYEQDAKAGGTPPPDTEAGPPAPQPGEEAPPAPPDPSRIVRP